MISKDKKQPKDNRPVCPDCNIPMGKSGLAWSGRRKVQRWKCSGCGRVFQDTSKEVN